MARRATQLRTAGQNAAPDRRLELNAEADGLERSIRHKRYIVNGVARVERIDGHVYAVPTADPALARQMITLVNGGFLNLRKLQRTSLELKDGEARAAGVQQQVLAAQQRFDAAREAAPPRGRSANRASPARIIHAPAAAANRASPAGIFNAPARAASLARRSPSIVRPPQSPPAIPAHLLRPARAASVGRRSLSLPPFRPPSIGPPVIPSPRQPHRSSRSNSNTEFQRFLNQL